jgi:hypothetical protein
MGRKIAQKQKKQKMSHSLRTYRQGDHFVGEVTDLSTGKVVVTKMTGERKGEGNTLTHLSGKLRSTGLLPAGLTIRKNTTVEYALNHRP